jgi:hypothetical protein
MLPRSSAYTPLDGRARQRRDCYGRCRLQLGREYVIAVAALARPISRSFVRTEIQTQFPNSVDQGARAGNGGNNVNVAVNAGQGRPLQPLR